MKVFICTLLTLLVSLPSYGYIYELSVWKRFDKEAGQFKYIHLLSDAHDFGSKKINEEQGKFFVDHILKTAQQHSLDISILFEDLQSYFLFKTSPSEDEILKAYRTLTFPIKASGFDGTLTFERPEESTWIFKLFLILNIAKLSSLEHLYFKSIDPRIFLNTWREFKRYQFQDLLNMGINLDGYSDFIRNEEIDKSYKTKVDKILRAYRKKSKRDFEAILSTTGKAEVLKKGFLSKNKRDLLKEGILTRGELKKAADEIKKRPFHGAIEREIFWECVRPDAETHIFVLAGGAHCKEIEGKFEKMRFDKIASFEPKRGGFILDSFDRRTTLAKAKVRTQRKDRTWKRHGVPAPLRRWINTAIEYSESLLKANSR